MSKITNGVIKNGMKIGDATVISTDLLKAGHAIPYASYKPTSITIHETDCPDVNAKTIYKSLSNANVDTTRTKASFQITVDADNIRQCVNLLRTCWHAGDATGNKTSIGIEICQYSKDKEKQKKAYKNTAELVKILKSELGITKVYRHYDWTKKNCPSYILNKKYSGLTWEWFTNLLATKEYKQLPNGDYNKKYKVISNTLNVREARPDKNGNLAKVKFVLKEGDIVEVGYVNNGWASIWVEGDMGYINSSNKYITSL